MSGERIVGAFWDNLGRALFISAIVGSSLVLINHGDHIEEEPICSHFALKVVLCYLVPFGVSMVSALLAGRREPLRRASKAPDRAP